MFRREKRALLRHYLEQGVPKAEIARRVGVSRRTVYHWIETGQLDRELDAEPVRYGPRRRAPSKLDPYKAVIDDRLATYPKLSATRLYREVRESGYDGSYSQVKRYVRGVRPGAEPAPERRFETPPGHQGQVDFADFVLPWGKRYALVVVLGYSRMLWLQYYERQTMETVVRGLEGAFAFFGGVPAELLFDQMRAVVVGDGRSEGGRLLENREFLRFSALRDYDRLAVPMHLRDDLLGTPSPPGGQASVSSPLAVLAQVLEPPVAEGFCRTPGISLDTLIFRSSRLDSIILGLFSQAAVRRQPKWPKLQPTNR